MGFKATFRLEHTIFLANNTTEALAFLQDNPDIRIVFCDQRMPDKTGVQFFEEIRSSFPNPIRILITGYTDIESVIQAINLGNIFRYIKKPWLEEDILSAINEGNKFYIANSLIAIKNESLQKAYNELDKFAYSVSHDLRGPLLSLIGAIDIAQDIDDIGTIRDLLKMMRESVNNLEEFIQNIHDYYNITRGQLQITEIDFDKIVQEQLNTYNLTAKMNKVSFKTQVTQKSPFRSDPIPIKIILNNLLSNAFKYQKIDKPGKQVNLGIVVESGQAIITVQDNGIGIAANYIGDIFNMFFRGTSQGPGSGFGLYNVKDALLKLNGEIKVDSVVDQGTTFKVIIGNK